MPSKELVERLECTVCNLPNVVAINNDLFMKRPLPLIIKRNNLKTGKGSFKQLIDHFRHIEDMTTALASHLLHEDAVKLKNTAIETNLALDQIDILSIKVYDQIEKLERVGDDDNFHKTVKSFSDLLKRKIEYLNFHHKISGKQAMDDIKAASLLGIVEQVSRTIGDEKVKKIKEGDTSTAQPLERHLTDDNYLNKLYAELDHEIKNKKRSV